ncbi:MAG: histidine phosphatase family protein, partial [Myxococcota bacterium]
SEANAARVFSGHQDVALTSLGRKQAQEAGAVIHQILGTDTIQSAFSSDLQRAKITAEITLGCLNSPPSLQISEALRERNLGTWQGESIDKLKATGAKDVLLTWKGAAPGGESLYDLALRSIPFLMNRHDKKRGPHLLVGHGGLIRMLIGLIDDAPLEEIGLININNAEPIVRDIESGLWTRIHNRITG